MDKREKVKRGLELCAYDPDPGQELKEIRSCPECPYYRAGCSPQLIRDALSLLREYDTALKLMVFQYCNYEEGFYHRFMSAGEEAFRVLGIENGQSTNGVWEKWFQTNERGEDNA